MRLRFLTLLLAAGALSAACSEDNTGPDGEARVRVVHASPNAPDVDVLLDNVDVLLDNADAEVLNDVPYPTASDYLDVPAGDETLKVNAVGTATTVIDADVSLVDGTDYTVIVGGLVEAIEPIVLQDDNSAPTAGRVTPAGTKTVVIDSGTLALSSGQVRTAIAVDAAGGGRRSTCSSSRT